jgi:hypothetical protein
MQYLNNDILCLEYEEFVPIIMVKNTYDRYKQRGNITVHGIGGNGRKVLIEYESLPSKYKQAVKKHYGDPYEYAAKQPILNSLEWDTKALDFYNSYVLPNGDKLPNSDTDLRGRPQINYVHRYTTNATWLNMLGRLMTDKRALKRELNISIMQFWETATDMIRIKEVDLPKNARRLKDKLKSYRQGGYESLIEVHKFGNSHSKKVADEEAEALLQELLAHRNRFDDTVIADTYNRWAQETNRKTITPAAVGYWRKKWQNRLMLERDGLGKTSSKLSKQIKRKRASAPLLFINSDDNVMDAFFRNGDNDWYRPALYVVIDTFNDYILGYAWGDTVTKDLVKEAYRNAHRHVMQITGESYCWQQIQTDRWGISGKNTTDLEQFYNSMGTLVPAALKNAQSKYIERAFGTTWHQKLKQVFLHNYSGYNVTAKTKLNTDNRKPADFPDITEAAEMIDTFIWAMRNTRRKDSDLTRHEEWLQAFHGSEKAKKKLLTPEKRLQIFGKVHDRTNTITAGGLTPTLLGQRRVYELSQEQIFQHIGKKVQVHYDENDLSQVLVTDGKGLRFVATEYGLVPAAFADYEEGDGARIKQLQAEKKTLLPTIQGYIEDRRSVLERSRIDAESRLQAGVMVKEIAHQDQRLLTQNAHQNGTKMTQNVPEGKGVCAENGTNGTVKKPLKPLKQPEKSIYDEY